MRTTLLPLLATLIAAPALATDYDESVSGDLSDDNLNPTPFVLTSGSNVFTASQKGNAFTRDIDYFSIVIPAGMQLSRVDLNDYVADGGNLAFLGMVEGAFFPKDAGTTKADDLLGGVVYGSGDIGTDLLPSIGTLAGAIGFIPPLPEGTYAIWLNQTGAPSTATLDFVVTDADLGTVYCDESQNPNNAADLSIDTLDSSASSINITLSSGPSNQFVYLLVGDGNGTVSQPPGAKGDLCVVGGSCLGRYDKDIGQIDGSGTYSIDILNAIATPCAGGVNIAPGATWNFQMWHRQQMGQPATFSHALSVTFQ